MRRLSIGGAVTIAVICIGILFILLSWLAGNLFRDAAHQSQTKSLSRIIEVASNQILKNLQQQALDLSGALNRNARLSHSLLKYQQGKPAPLLELLDDPLRNGYAGIHNTDLVQLRVYDLQLDFLAESRVGQQGLRQSLPGFILVQALKREGVERLKAIGGLWVSATHGPLYSMLLPIGGLKLEGYLELIFDPAYSLTRVGEITSMPLSVSLASAPPPRQTRTIEQSGLLQVEYLLVGDDNQPAYRLIGLEDVRQFNKDMHDNQLTTTLVFISLTFITLLLLLLMLNRGVFKPLRNMLQGIEAYRSGELDTRIKTAGLRELFTLGETFNSMIEQLQLDIQQLKRYSNRDGLTGLSNRRYFEQRLKDEWSRALRQQSPIALLFIDIDFFKRYNDHYGHLQGDDCLRRVAKAIQQAVKRDIDVTARYGGEEFIIMLPDTNLSGAEQVARELQKAIRKLHIEHSGSNVEPFVTLSIGIASQIPTFPEKADVLIKAADEALYQAKGRGRNCIGKFSASA